jgi:uncharacterized protein YprB with RNaseH-like and TPR domain
MLINSILLKKCLFIDIETVPEMSDFSDLSEIKKKLWEIKAAQIRKYLKPEEENKSAEELYTDKAGIFAEFAKVVCISCGYLVYEGDVPVKVRIKSLAGNDEKKILQDFADLLVRHYADIETSKICGHNIKEFDIPFICRRWVIHQIPFPPVLDISGKKPWQTQHLLDTMDMWRFGDYKNFTSLNLLAGTLGIPTPKDDIDGSQVGTVYWQEQNLDRIVTYCQKDVLTVVQIVMRFACVSLFHDEQVEILPWKPV